METHLGEKAFFGILRGWIEKTRGKNATTEDLIQFLDSQPLLRDAFQQKTGLTFREYFEFWNSRPRLPRLALQERAGPSGKVILKLEVQDKDLPPKLFTVPIVIRDVSGNILKSFKLAPGQEIQVDQFDKIEVDPEATALAAIDEPCLSELPSESSKGK